MHELDEMWDEIEQRHADQRASGYVEWFQIFSCSVGDALASDRVIHTTKSHKSSHAFAKMLIESGLTMRWCLVPGWSDYVFGFETVEDAIKARLMLADDPYMD